MANTLTISFLEMLLMKGMAVSEDWFKDEHGVRWVYEFDVDKFTGKRNIKKAIDAAIHSGLIEMNSKIGDADSGYAIRLSKLGEKLLKAAEPKEFELYLTHAK